MTTFTGAIITFQSNAKAGVIPAWTDNPYSDNRHPLGWLGAGTSAGPATNKQPIHENPIAFAGVRLPTFFDDFYNRILIEPSTIDAGNVSSEQVRSLSIFNGFFVPVTITEILGTAVDGVTLALIAPYLIGALGTIETTLTVSTVGPPDINGAFKFSFDVYQDITLPIVGSRVIVLPYQPELGLTERLEWTTQIVTSNNGAEQRIQNRQRPRQFFNGKYHVPSNELARADNILYGWLGQHWAIAVWSESQIVSVLAGTDTIVCETGNSDLRAGGLLMIWANTGQYEVIGIQSVNSGNVVLNRIVVGSYPRALLMPVRSGLGGATSKVQKTGVVGSVEMEFEVLDNIDYSVAAPAQYLGEDLYFDAVLMQDSGFADSYINRVDTIDYGTSIETYLPWLNLKVGRPHYYVMQNRTEVWAFRMWLFRRAGKAKPYWVPTFESNFTLAMKGLVSNSLIVNENNYKGLGEKHNHIAIEYDDGSWRACAVTGIALVDDNTTSIAINISLNVDALRIRRISFLTLKRLDTDSVSLSWVGNSVATANIPMMEIQP